MTLELPRLGTYWTGSAAFPYGHVSLNVDQPLASVDTYGLGDLYVQPVKLGRRWTHLDLVTSYAFYAPTGKFEPAGKDGICGGQWSHEFALGGTLYAGERKMWRLSALSSYVLNQRKRSVDITRGDTVQLQGGAGAELFRILDVGITGYALWQVRDD